MTSVYSITMILIVCLDSKVVRTEGGLEHVFIHRSGEARDVFVFIGDKIMVIGVNSMIVRN